MTEKNILSNRRMKRSRDNVIKAAFHFDSQMDNEYIQTHNTHMHTHVYVDIDTNILKLKWVRGKCRLKQNIVLIPP